MKTPLQEALSKFTGPFMSGNIGMVLDQKRNVVCNCCGGPRAEDIKDDQILATGIADFLNSQIADPEKRDVYHLKNHAIGFSVYKNKACLISGLWFKDAQMLTDELNRLATTQNQ